MKQFRNITRLALIVLGAAALSCSSKQTSSEGPGALKREVIMAESARAATERAQAPAESVATHADVTYTCEMHPEVTSDHPGQCPKCGMELIVRK